MNVDPNEIHMFTKETPLQINQLTGKHHLLKLSNDEFRYNIVLRKYECLADDLVSPVAKTPVRIQTIVCFRNRIITAVYT